MRALSRSIAAALTMAVAIGAAAAAQERAVESGRRIYLRECASCHGVGATGYGVASWVLKVPPPDLTRLSTHTTPFPRDAIRNVLTGHIRPVPSHGRTEMPFWRSSLAKPAADGTTEIDALLAYLEDMQLRKFGPYAGPSFETRAASGATLFKAHCVGCHGENGQGVAPPGYVVGIMPPDLTTFASRRGAPLASAAIYEAIARCEDRTRTSMPSWRESFRRAGWGDHLSVKYIEALAEFVASIQQP